MRIGGLQKLTLIDYPGQLAATVFTLGCSMRCSFCHNPELVIVGQGAESFKEKDFFDFLKKRQGKLTGVCLTGGEPTIQPDILEFALKIKKLGFKVKLDTNGTRPDVVRKMIKEKAADYIAMDVKNSLKNYDLATGIKTDKDRIKLSVEIIKNSRLPYEFRTTVVPGIHREEDFLSIAEWLKGSRAYWLQKYQDIKILDPRLKKKVPTRELDLEKIKKMIEKNFKQIGVRG
jgi:pyruvate formate lyase activating enzyme